MRSCRERLMEQVAERTAAGGSGVYFSHVPGGWGPFFKKTARRTYRGRQCRWRSELL